MRKSRTLKPSLASTVWGKPVGTSLFQSSLTFCVQASKRPTLARSVQKPLKVPSLARSVPKPLKMGQAQACERAKRAY